MTQSVFVLQRDTYRGLTTIGTLTCPDGTVMQTLEDCVRAFGIKDKGNTAIPATGTDKAYRLSITMSQRFEREMVIVHTENDKVTLKAEGIEFKGIRIHGGNSAADVQGCIVVAKNRISDQRVQGTQESIITKLVRSEIQKGNECYLVVINNTQPA
jgi:hypothetical protein